ncbi:MAG: phosphatase PAP2 family protein [Ignavibacteriales bacterium]|nr:MAG: phosphatase PAP2 family protein [Ignavibacteriales bacterium]
MVFDITLIQKKLFFMIKKFFYPLLVLILLSSQSFAQNKYDISQFYNESIHFVKQPLNWEGSDWLKLGLVSAGTILAMQADQPIRDAVLRDQSFNGTVPELIGRYWGRGYATIFFAGAFGLHGLITDDQTTKKIGFEIVQATIYAGAITQFLKMTLGRARPYTNEGTRNYHPFSLWNDDYHALPSGEVTLAFSLSTVLSKNSKSDLLKIICYLPAVLTMASRVNRDMHWSSDTFLAAAIGYFVGDWVTNLHERQESAVEISAVYPLTIRIKL